MYTIVFPGADASAVRLGQRQDLLLHGETKGAKQTKSNRDLPPVQFAAYFGVRSWWNVILVAFYGAIFALLARFSWGRRLLLDYSWLFTHGVFVKGTTPSEEQLKGCSMETILIGRGYKSGSDQGGKPDREIVGKVSGPVSFDEGIAVVRTTSKLKSTTYFSGTGICRNTHLYHQLCTPVAQRQAFCKGRQQDPVWCDFAVVRLCRHGLD